MAKTRTYIVSFNRAARTDWGGYTITFDIGQPTVRHQVTCNNFVQLEDEVRHLAAEFGLPCSSYIRLPKGERNPPGFDRFCKTLNIIEAAPVAA